ncbi:hypothetical protein [Metabacillus niabensis]|uniref:Lipoprotein n=1 Tax=Metabacillus niabensis TaxID=324854 RepID=A0ABT9Z2N8_9BACI|nr:hypothetical protein [Metabacillus niabensis]MDQ0226528.1 hypothetical protein [Metabacillus niabensis]
MKRFLFLLIGLILLIYGCDQDAEINNENLGCSGENCKLVYDGSQYHTYDIKIKSLTGKIDSTDNEFQYRLPGNDLYVTSGNSIENNFKIMKNENERLHTVYEHKNNKEAIFPIAVIDDNYIFAVMEYTSEEQTFKGFFQLNEKDELEQIKTESNEKTEKIFGVGISSNNNIFLLLHDEDRQDLYKTNLSLSKFELVAKDVSQNLSTFSGDVCYLKTHKIFCGNKVLKELEEGSVFAWVLDEYILEVNDMGSYEVRDVNDQKLLHSGTEFIGFDISPSEVIIYSDSKMLVLGD